MSIARWLDKQIAASGVTTAAAPEIVHGHVDEFDKELDTKRTLEVKVSTLASTGFLLDRLL